MTTAVSNPSLSTPSGASLAGFSAEKRRDALHSMVAAAAMTVLKLAAGLFSGSLGVLSDAAHSGLDLVGVTLTFFSVQLSDKPADDDHTYGHGKFENLSSFLEAGLVNRIYLLYGNKIVGRGLEGLRFSKGLPLGKCIRLDKMEMLALGRETFGVTGIPVIG